MRQCQYDLTIHLRRTAIYSLYVSSTLGEGVLEEFALSFTLRTSPIKTDSDGDSLNDSEETTYGVDAWITDPNRVDTDFDAWSDSYEIQTKGTSPTAWDTDQDGVGDSSDLDPLRNLLVAVHVKQLHHGDAWWDPTLTTVVRVNEGNERVHTWVTEYRIGSQDGSDDHTASFWMTYYADVPDQVSGVSLRMTGWSYNCCRNDDIIVDTSVTYSLNSGTSSFVQYSGNSWLSFDVWTHALPKARTLLVTDGNATVQASGGQHRLTGQDRYFVLTFDVTSSYAPFVYGINTIVVPRSIFLDSKLKADFAAGSYWPLDGDSAKLYGEDLGKADVSEGVAGVIAKSFSGSNAKNVLDRLLRNSANVLTYSYVDITSYAVLTNLPADVVRILPWAGVVNGATGAAPEGFTDWFLNRLVEVGQLLYKGLVALATFLVDLGKAIVDWGMRALGTVSQAVGQAVQKVADALDSFLDWVVAFATVIVETILDVLIQPIADTLQGWGRHISESISSCVASPNCSASALAAALGGIVLGGTLFIALLAMVGGIALIETATKPIVGIAFEVASIVVDIVVGLIVGALIALLIPAAYTGSQDLADLIPASVDGAIAAAFGAIEFSIALSAYLATQTRTLKSLSFIAPVSLAVSIAGLLVLTAKTLATQETKEFAHRRIILDVIEIGLVTFALAELEIPGPIKRWYKILWKADQAFGVIAIVAGFTELVRDVQLALE